MSAYKILFTGPVGAGKTTAIAAVSDIEPFQTEELATDDTRELKDNTTVAMDYGVIKLATDERIHLYGTPGQKRFDFMWEILTEGGIGLVLLINHTNPDPLRDFADYLDAFSDYIRSTAVAVGITRMNESEKYMLDDYLQVLESKNIQAPIFEIDARNPDDVAVLVQALLYSIDPGLE